MQKIINFRVHKGPKFALEIVKEETDLTAEMLESYVTVSHWAHSMLTIAVARGRVLPSRSIISKLLEQTSAPELCTH